jgi:hypothetical protein
MGLNNQLNFCLVFVQINGVPVTVYNFIYVYILCKCKWYTTLGINVSGI